MNRSAGSQGWTGILTLAGVAGLLFVSIGTWKEMRSGRQALDDRLGKLETRLTQISAKVDSAARPAPAQRGPDPNRVYAVKTDGAPTQGPRNAPVVIAEFSDFQ